MGAPVQSRETSLPRITILGTHHPDAMELLAARPEFDVNIVDDPYLPRPHIEEAIKGTDAIAVRTTKLDASLLETCPDVRIISRHGVGTDSVDVAWMSARGKPVAIAAGGNDRSVAEHTLGMMLSLARSYKSLTQDCHNTHWTPRAEVPSFDLQERTLLIVGHGRIGSRVAELARVFGMRVLVSDPYINVPEGVEAVSLEQGVAEADIVTVHCFKNEETTGLIGTDAIAAMKPGAILINCARGGIVDEDACAAALHSGHLRGYGCDVFSVEPMTPDNPILSAPNTILTPHSAATTPQGTRKMSIIGIQNVLDCFDGKLRPEMVFNRQELGL